MSMLGLWECIWHVVEKGISRLQMRRGWGGGDRHQCRLSQTHSSDGDVPEESSWHKAQVCDYWTSSTHRSWCCHTLCTTAKRQQSRQWCSFTCFDSQHFAEISREKWEWKHFQSWQQKAQRAAQTCSGGISLKVIQRLLPRVLRAAADKLVVDDKARAPGSCAPHGSCSLQMGTDWTTYSSGTSLPFTMQHRKANPHPFQFVLKCQAAAGKYQDLFLYMMRVML